MSEELRALVVRAHEHLDPNHQGLGWPDPIAWDGRPLEEQARDLSVLLDGREDDGVAAGLSQQLWDLATQSVGS